MATPALTGLSGMSGMIYAPATSGVDPATDANFTGAYDPTDAVTDGDGVYSWPEAEGSGFDFAQTTGSLKPAKPSGVQGDGSDDELTGTAASLTWADLIDADGFAIVIGLTSPSSISTDNAPALAYLNETLFGETSGGNFGWFHFASTGPTMGAVMSSSGYKGPEVTIALSTQYAAAIRHTGSSLDITLDGITFASVAVGNVGNVGTVPRMFANFNSSAHPDCILHYAAFMDATKTDGEIEDFLGWITANKLP